MKFFIALTIAFGLALTGSVQASASLNDLMTTRHSGRSFDPSIPVTEQQIHSIVEAARLVPSAFNDQPWVVIVTDRQLTPEAYATALSLLVEANRKWAQNAPTLLIILTKTHFTRDKTENPWAFYDTGAAAFGMELQAVELGLMAHQIGGFDANKVKSSFGVPEGYVPITMMAIGYELNPDKSYMLLKRRFPLPQNFFLGRWGKGLEGNGSTGWGG